MLIITIILAITINMAIFVGLLFLPAGTLDWWRAWVLLGLILVGIVAATVSMFRTNMDLLKERMKGPIQRGQPRADKIVAILFVAAYFALIGFVPLDVFHLHLLDKPGIVASSLGMGLFLAGWWIITLALRENSFASAAVRHQEERQQQVIDTGVYAVVRHPMYAGIVPFLVGMSLRLESYAAALLTSVPIGILALRILVEERFLKRELKGYDAYTERVPYRLIPFLW